MLWTPGGANKFGALEASWGTSRPTGTMGTSVTPSTSAYGSWASLMTVTRDTYGILICINSNYASAASRNTVIKLGIDEAGGTAYEDRILDLLAGGAAAYNGAGGGIWYFFPLWIPAGASLAVAAYSTVTTALMVGAMLSQEPTRPEAVRVGKYIDAIGISGTREGTILVPGTTSEGAWTLIGTLPRSIWWMQAALQVRSSDTSWNNNAIHMDVGVGDGTNMEVIIRDMMINTGSAESMINPPLVAQTEYDIPAGASLYVRAQSSATLDTYTCAVWGCGG